MSPDLDLLGDATRRLILALIRVEREACVCELVAAIDDVQPKISRQLALLREGGWLVSRREGTWIHYRMARLPPWSVALIDTLVAGGVPGREIAAARSRLHAFAGRPRRTAACASSVSG